MFAINNKGEGQWEVNHTRGDTAEFRVNLSVESEDGSKQAYEMNEKDTLTITLRRTTKSDIALQKTFSTPVIKMEPSDTEELDIATYRFDVQLDTADGDRYTLNRGDRSSWKLWDEVTY